jgi:5-formyltetrahydrofolate cyclo-ligase
MAQPSPGLRAERRRLRKARNAIEAASRRDAENLVVHKLLQLGIGRRGRRLAIYFAMPGELRLDRLTELAPQLGVTLYAPRIVSMRRRRMVFEPVSGARLRANSFGIVEPSDRASRQTGILSFDSIVVPMLGFDRRGNRLGMGAGFYDRALQIRKRRERRWRRPRLIGVAFSCQEVDSITASPWDVAMDLVVTEREIIEPNRSTHHEETRQ